ncbi:unnamed protein product, partial [Rotaria socialis]
DWKFTGDKATWNWIKKANQNNWPEKDRDRWLNDSIYDFFEKHGNCGCCGCGGCAYYPGGYGHYGGGGARGARYYYDPFGCGFPFGFGYPGPYFRCFGCGFPFGF